TLCSLRARGGAGVLRLYPANGVSRFGRSHAFGCAGKWRDIKMATMPARAVRGRGRCRHGGGDRSGGRLPPMPASHPYSGHTLEEDMTDTASDQERYDVIVVGSGAGGMTAAL